MKTLIAFASLLALASVAAWAGTPQVVLLAPQAGHGTCGAQQAMPMQMVPVQAMPVQMAPSFASYGCYGGGGAATYSMPAHAMPMQVTSAFAPSGGCYGGGGAAALAAPAYFMPAHAQNFMPASEFASPHVAEGMRSAFAPSAFAPVRGLAPGFMPGVGPIIIYTENLGRNF